MLDFIIQIDNKNLQRFQNMSIKDLYNKYFFLDDNKFFEFYNDELYLHIISLTGKIEWSLCKDNLMKYLKQYVKEKQHILNGDKNE